MFNNNIQTGGPRYMRCFHLWLCVYAIRKYDIFVGVFPPVLQHYWSLQILNMQAYFLGPNLKNKTKEIWLLLLNFSMVRFSIEYNQENIIGVEGVNASVDLKRVKQHHSSMCVTILSKFKIWSKLF